MTPRLKLLSALLCVSIVYAVYDYIDRNNIGKDSIKIIRLKIDSPVLFILALKLISSYKNSPLIISLDFTNSDGYLFKYLSHQ